MKFKTVRNAALIALITLLLSEITLRAWGELDTYSERASGNYISPYNQSAPSWYFTEKPNSEFMDVRKEFSYHYSFDSLGLLRNDSSSPDSAEIKILVMGDSFTFGIGAPQDSSFTRLLQNMLWDKCGKRVEVINASKQGSDPFFSSVLYRDRLASLKPDIVVLAINSSDILEVFSRGGFERFKSDGVVRTKGTPWFEPLYRYCHVARFLLKVFKGMRSEYLYNDNDYESIAKDVIMEIEGCLAGMNATVVANQSQFIVIPMPLPYEIRSNIENRFLKEDMLQPYMQQTVDDSLREFFKDKDITKYYWQVDGHFNSEGYRVLAGTVCDLMIEECDVLKESCGK